VTRLLPRHRLAVAGALVLCVLTASAYGAHRVLERAPQRTYPLYQFAENPAWFKAELERVAEGGGTIPLPAGRVAPLQLRSLTPSAPIRLAGRPGTVLTDISIQGSRRIVVSGVRIRPATEPAIVDVSDSRDVTFRNVRFLGLSEDIGVALQLDPDDRDITVTDSEFTRCQHALACILARGRGLTIDNVRFHDVRDADLVRGAADDVTITDSDLHDALPGTRGDNHNDLIQILGGGPWTIERSHFGVRANGAAQLYVDPRAGDAGPVHDVRIASNVFTGSNAAMYFAINVRDPASSSVPAAARVEIVNNTILSANIAAIVLGDGYAGMPESRRPLVQNNILGRQKHALCDVARTATNVIVSGNGCPGDRQGNPRVNGAGRPSAASAALLARGTERDAPDTDRSGRKRADPPAVGAYELP
jgi:Right handed beta helix region